MHLNWETSCRKNVKLIEIRFWQEIPYEINFVSRHNFIISSCRENQWLIDIINIKCVLIMIKRLRTILLFVKWLICRVKFFLLSSPVIGFLMILYNFGQGVKLINKSSFNNKFMPPYFGSTSFLRLWEYESTIIFECTKITLSEIEIKITSYTLSLVESC